MGFDNVKQQYAADVDFGSIWDKLEDGTNTAKNEFSIKDGYFFHGTWICILYGLFENLSSWNFMEGD